MRARIWLVCLVLCGALPVSAGVYKWTDEHGQVHYSDTPPQGASASQMQLDAAPRHPDEAHEVAERYKKAWQSLKAEDRARAEVRAEQARKAKAKARLCQELRKAASFYRERYATYRLDSEGKPVFLTDEELAARERKLEARYRDEGCRG